MTHRRACVPGSAGAKSRGCGRFTRAGASRKVHAACSVTISWRAVVTCDALIVGAGPAGSAAALLLARAGWSVALIEKAEFPRRKVCGEFISATSLPLL